MLIAKLLKYNANAVSVLDYLLHSTFMQSFPVKRSLHLTYMEGT